jgi:polyvinyl alcohol dehydrogenase (cytochrome)
VKLVRGRRAVVFAGLLVFAIPAAAIGVIGGSAWTSGGGNVSDTRSSDGVAPSVQSVSSLGKEWAFQYPTPSPPTSPGSFCSTQATPTVVGDAPGAPGAIYVPDSCGHLNALNPDTGVELPGWPVDVSALTGVAGDLAVASPAIEGDPSYTADANMVFFGDTGDFSSFQQHLDNGTPLSARLVAVDAKTGAAIWTTQLSPHPWARLRGSPLVYDGVVYQGVSSQEELASGLTYSSAQNTYPAGTPYPCCSFRGSVAAVDAATGRILWQTYTVPPGDNGGAVWDTTPAFSPATNTLFVTTGNNYTPPDPATLSQDHFDSVLALNASTGQIKWAARVQSNSDVYNHTLAACTGSSGTTGRTCPQTNPNGYGPFNYSPAGYGPNGCGSSPDPACPASAAWDYDLGAGPNLFTATVTSANCGINAQPTLIVGVGAKSGTYTALDASTGCVLWSTNVGPGGTGGGVEFGTATDGQRIYLQEKAPVDARGAGTVLYQIQQQDGTRVWTTASTLTALDPATGTILWQTADPNGNAFAGPPTVANGVLYQAENGGRGLMYAFDASTGNKLWELQNTFQFNGGTFSGGVSAGAAIQGGVVYWPGYATMWALALPGWSQLTTLLTAVTGVGPGTSLADKITATQGYVAAGDKTNACTTLATFVNLVKAQTNKKISNPASLIAQATAIEATIGC